MTKLAEVEGKKSNSIEGTNRQEIEEIKPRNEKTLSRKDIATLILPKEGEHNNIIKRLLKSIGMVKKILQYNLQLREQIQDLKQEIAQQKTELFHLYCENEEQKDKILILTKMNTSQLNIVEEIHQLKKDKAIIEQRVHFLELENAKYKEILFKLEKSKKDVKCPVLPKKNVFIYTESKPLKPPIMKDNGSVKEEHNNDWKHKDINTRKKKDDSYMAQRGANIFKNNFLKLKKQRNPTADNMSGLYNTIIQTESKKRCVTPIENLT